MGDSAIHAVAGAVGGAISMTLTYPLVNLSTRAAVATKHEDVSLKDAIVQTVKKEGLSGLYSGLESSLFGIALTNGIYYVSSGAGMGNGVERPKKHGWGGGCVPVITRPRCTTPLALGNFGRPRPSPYACKTRTDSSSSTRRLARSSSSAAPRRPAPPSLLRRVSLPV